MIVHFLSGVGLEIGLRSFQCLDFGTDLDRGSFFLFSSVNGEGVLGINMK